MAVAPVELLEQFQECRNRGDWQGMRAVFHEDALSETLARPGRAFPPGELIHLITRAMTSGVYGVNEWRIEEIDEHAALAHGHARFQSGGGFTDEKRTWIFTFRDGLVWRSRIFATRDDALACLAAEGPDLGLHRGD